MITMIFAYYSVDNLKEIDFNKRSTISLSEWIIYAITPQLLFYMGFIVAFFVYRPDDWVIVAMAITAVGQAFTALTEEGGLVRRLLRAMDRADQTNAALSASNSQLLETQQHLRQTLADAEALAADLTSSNSALAESNHQLLEAQGHLQQALLNAEDLAAEHERSRVANEIHDGLGMHLSATRMHLEVARRLIGTDPTQAAASFVIARDEAAAAQHELRRAVETLNGEVAARPLDALLAGLVRTNELTGLRTTLAFHGNTRPLAYPVQHALYRVAQEALHNVRRHAHATRVAVELDFRAPNLVQLRVADNGIGLRPNQLSPPGHGLRSMHNRVTPLGGTLEIISQPDQGVSLCVTMPLI